MIFKNDGLLDIYHKLFQSNRRRLSILLITKKRCEEVCCLLITIDLILRLS